MEIGVSSIPVSEVSHPPDTRLRSLSLSFQFYCEEHCTIGESYARFSFCKDIDTLRQAGEKLQSLTKYIS